MLPAEIIEKYLGVNYKHHGRDLSGLDCYGLILRIFEDQGITLWDINEEYNDDWSWQGRNLFVENYAHGWEFVDDYRFMDVACFQNGKGVVNHAGIYLGENKFIHAVKAGVVVSRFMDREWQKRWVGFYRYRGKP